MTCIETDRLTIRNFVPGDWRDLHEMIVRYQASPYAAYDHEWPTSEEGIKGAVTCFAGGGRFLAVCLKATGKLIGLVSLNERREGDHLALSLGYVFNGDYHGAGYATEACTAALDHGFRELGAERAAAGTALENEPSCRLLGRLGFTKTGESVASLRSGPDGAPIEFIAGSFVLSKEEWLARPRRRA